jgi:hypothetical protein
LKKGVDGLGNGVRSGWHCFDSVEVLDGYGTSHESHQYGDGSAPYAHGCLTPQTYHIVYWPSSHVFPEERSTALRPEAKHADMLG